MTLGNAFKSVFEFAFDEALAGSMLSTEGFLFGVFWVMFGLMFVAVGAQCA